MKSQLNKPVYLCQGFRTPIGKFTGSLSSVRADDLLAGAIKHLLRTAPGVEVDDVIIGCANQAGEDSRNVARMGLLLAGLPESVPGITVNRLCASGMSAVVMAAASIRSGEAEVIVAGGVEQMTRAPYVMGKAESAYARNGEIFDTTLGWRFVNPEMKTKFGADSMGETAENVAEMFKISREVQDRFALSSQIKATSALKSGRLAEEICPVEIPQKKGPAVAFCEDELIRQDSSPEALARLQPAFRAGGTVTAGNSSGINDGSCVVVIASEDAVKRFNLQPQARLIGSIAVGVEPRIMGMGPVAATKALLNRLGLKLAQIDVIELNEAFAAQAVACLRELGLTEDDPRVNPNGGAIALGHPLGMSGARLLLTAAKQLQIAQRQRALCTMCVGVGQGVATIIERV